MTAIRKVDKSKRNCPAFGASSLITLRCRVSRRKFPAIAFDRRARTWNGRSIVFSYRSVSGKCQEKQCRQGIPPGRIGIDAKVNYERVRERGTGGETKKEGEMGEEKRGIKRWPYSRALASKRRRKARKKEGRTGGETYGRIMRFRFRWVVRSGQRETCGTTRKSSSHLIPHSALVSLSRVISLLFFNSRPGSRSRTGQTAAAIVPFVSFLGITSSIRIIA